MAARRRRPRSRLARVLLNDTLIAVIAVVGVVLLVALLGLVLTWMVFRDRYEVGFVEYLRLFVF